MRIGPDGCQFPWRLCGSLLWWGVSPWKVPLKHPGAKAGGGTRPLWVPRAQELVYVAPSGAVMSLAVPSGPSGGPTTPKLLVKDGYYTNPLDPIRTYDVSPAGQRFLLIKQDRSAPQTAAASDSVVVVLNWAEELERLAPLK